MAYFRAKKNPLPSYQLIPRLCQRWYQALYIANDLIDTLFPYTTGRTLPVDLFADGYLSGLGE